MKAQETIIYRVGRAIIHVSLGFYFSRIVRFHAERVPASGPVLFTSNHPNSLTDAFVIGTSVPRKVNFVATVQLFRIRALRWLLTQCGVIPVNRVKDNPRAMRSVMDTFEACFRVLEKGEAVGIFPEGITHDDPQLKAVKTGAARMALELEHRHEGRLGLQIMPVGLAFSAKETYRSEALVHFGEPIKVAEYLAPYGTNRHTAIQSLSAEIERRIQSLIYHLPKLERARIVEAVRRLYLDKLRVANTVIHEPVPPEAGELLLTQAIVSGVDHAFAENPGRAAEFVRKLDHYEATLKRLHLPEDVLVHFPERSWILKHSAGWSALALLGAPAAIYGWIHRLIPYQVVQWIVRRSAKQLPDKTHVSTATIVAGSIVFSLFYLACVLMCQRFFGWRPALWYALTLVPASLAAHYYLRELRRFGACLRALWVLLRARKAGPRLLAMREALISLIEAEHSEIVAARLGAKPEAAT